jgi:hypothetical protein
MPRPLPALPRRLQLVAAGQQGLLTIAQCDASGVDRGRRARLVAAGTLRRVARGIVDTRAARIADRIAAREYDHVRLRKVWLAQLLAGPGSVAVGQAALVVAGVHGIPWQFVPEVAYLDGRYGRSSEHVVIRQIDLGDRHFERNGLRYTEPERALGQAVPTMDRRTAIAVIDSARFRGVVDAAGLARAREHAKGRRGSVRAAPWWDESVENAESVLESLARTDCVDAGVPPDELQVKVFGPDGTLLGRGDMGFRLADGRLLVVEIDGSGVHSELAALFRDRSRQNDLVALGGAMILRFTWNEVREPGRVGEAVRSVVLGPAEPPVHPNIRHATRR